jgi:hypothetical protein
MIELTLEEFDLIAGAVIQQGEVLKALLQDPDYGTAMPGLPYCYKQHEKAAALVRQKGVEIAYKELR